ncbi:hypothetical protein EDB83DRAFT_2377738 [Lactarius deliciosus]|nr:hypothetical protein EDB83DRAFT_2377738 [Lactarius deliciosus]
MAPKKGQKMSLNEFLGDDTLGSWADEMDALPTAPAARGDDDRGDRRGGRDDYLSSRQDRQSFPPREDLPLPTQPPYTAFVGNLAFDLTENDLETFFDGLKTKSVKVIKDRDERPKGFGYVEFEDLDDLKAALTKTGSTLAGRTVRVSVAEPPKERSGPGGFDDPKFSGEWRRQGPLPDRDSSRRRYDGPPTDRSAAAPTSVSDTASDWRSNRPARLPPPPESEGASRRKNSSSFASESAADKEETWTIGGKFKPSEDEGTGRKFGSFRARGDMPPPSGPPESSADNDWRSAPRAGLSSHSSTSLDVTAREKVIAERLDKEREVTKDRVGQHSMSRSNSRQGAPRTPPFGRSGDTSLPPSPRVSHDTILRRQAGGKRDEESKEDDGPKVNDITEQLGEVTI